jgi:hypothetical protein
MPDTQTLFGAAATILGIYGYIPYFRGIYLKTTKPHSFSWFLWGLLTLIAFIAQITNDAGAGAWVTGMTVIACFTIAGFGLKHFHENVRPIDWVFLVVSLGAIPLWLLTDSPFYAVILITIIDYVATFPTIRKSWYHPDTEVAQTYFLSGIKFVLSICAMETINFANTFYPAAIVVLNLGIVVLLLYRRQKMRP